MATKDFTAKQKEILARKMGYDGPMQGFDEYLKSDPSLARKYGAVLDKYMARGGMAKKYKNGGIVTDALANIGLKRKAFAVGGAVTRDLTSELPSDWEGYDAQTKIDWFNSKGATEAELKNAGVSQDNINWMKDNGFNPASTQTAKATSNVSEGMSYATADGGIGADQYYENIRNYVEANPGLSASQLQSEAAKWGVSSSDVAKALEGTNITTESKAAAVSDSEGFRYATGEGGIGAEQYYQNIRDFIAANPGMSDAELQAEAAKYGVSSGDVAYALISEKKAVKPATVTYDNTVRNLPDGAPPAPDAPVVEAAQIQEVSNQIVSTQAAPAAATQATAAPVAPTAQAAAPKEKDFTQVTAATTAADTAKALEKLSPVQGTVSEQAQVTAETMAPDTTALANLQAAQGTAQQIQAPTPRTVQEGELISGPSVDMARVEAELAKTEAAQGEVTEEMTVQGQLNKLLADFDAKNPPPWAAGSMRSVTAILSERGLGASSLAGQAIIQATLESALPIATADAATYREMAAQNLSNRQQTAMLLAQQRAQFLGQEFDQDFQTKVLNAAKIADIANMNFSADVQIAMENARLAQTMDLANLNNKQAVVMANAAQIANLEMANLNNRQQAAVLNAQAFLQMDMQNLSNAQQMEMFKAQSVIQSIFTDTAMENATRQFNSTGEAQTSQFFAGLSTQVSQFNASQMNAMEEFRVSQANSISTFNATQQNQRDQFNAEFRRIIDQSNAEWRRQIATLNTQAQNQVAMFNAQNALQVSMAEYNNLWQGYRDDIEMAWKTGENAADRDNQIALQVISKEAQILSARMQADALKYQALGGAAATILGKTSLGDAAVSGVTKLIDKLTGGDTDTSWLDELLEDPGDISGSDTSELDELLNEFGTVKNEDTGITIEDVENELYGGG